MCSSWTSECEAARLARVEPAGARLEHRRGAGGDGRAHGLLERPPGDAGGEEAGQERVPGADDGGRLDARRLRPHAHCGAVLPEQRVAAVSSVMRTLRAPRSAISSSPAARSSSSTNSWPTSASASRWFGETRYGSASTAEPERLALGVDDGEQLAAVELAHELAVEAGVDAARQRAGQDDELGAAGRGRRASRAGCRAPPR